MIESMIKSSIDVNVKISNKFVEIIEKISIDEMSIEKILNEKVEMSQTIELIDRRIENRNKRID